MAISSELALIKEAYENGDIDALQAYAELKDFETQLAQLLDYLKPLALDCIDRYGNNSVAHGYMWSKVADVEYDYFHIDPIREGEERLKTIKDLLTRLKKEAQKGEIKDTESGAIYPPAKRIEKGYKLVAKKVTSI